MAGNTLDKASLLTALLQASGFTTRYEHIYLNDTSVGDTAEVNLIRTMFPPTTVLLGCIPPGAGTGDPGYNGYAENDSDDYYWVEYGPGLIDLDPNLPNGTPGQSLAQTTGQTPDTFSTVSTNLQQQVTININAEQYSQASGLFGFVPPPF
jgi:transglutaminase-like putative cysteine protease